MLPNQWGLEQADNILSPAYTFNTSSPICTFGLLFCSWNMGCENAAKVKFCCSTWPKKRGKITPRTLSLDCCGNKRVLTKWSIWRFTQNLIPSINVPIDCLCLDMQFSWNPEGLTASNSCSVQIALHRFA